MCPCLYFGYLGKPTEMGIVIIAGVLTASFLNLDKFHEIKAGALSLKLAKEVINEAHVTVEKLKQVSVPLITAALTSLTYGGRWEGISEDKQHLLVDRLKSASEALKSEEVELAIKEFHLMNTRDMYNNFMHELFKQDYKISEKFGELESEYLPSEKQIYDLLGDFSDKLSPQAKAQLEDYLYYKQHQKRKY